MQQLPAKVAESLVQLVTVQRHSAHFVVDEAQIVVRCGGQLAHYGLGDLACGLAVAEQLPFMEGMLPLPETPFLMRSLEMPSGRVADVHFFAEGEWVWVVLIDMTAEHDETQKLQQKAYDMTLLSEREAKLIAQLEAANAELVRAHRELAESREALLLTHNRLRAELHEAERYVRACLPAPIREPFAVDWLFVPTAELGGDSFGYHWLDDTHFAFYLLDVCGHGIGAALLSVAANQTLRVQALPGVDFREPDAVLDALNQVYQMDRHNELFFTLWYGVYEPGCGRLRYASAGHPAPVLVQGPAAGPVEARSLPAKGPALGILPFARYQSQTCSIVRPSRLFLFSDGVFEIARPDGTMLDTPAFQRALVSPEVSHSLDDLLAFARHTRGADTLEDDFSIIKIEL
ncbi:MAG: PP2C family protein-serine/threonine phosphatase [Panacagrimonas sp.]